MRGLRYLARRIGAAIFLLIGISALSFLLADLAPGNFFDDMKLNPQISTVTVARLRAQYGFDRPLPSRYLRWITSVLNGDLGYSLAYNMPVSELIWGRLRNTVLLGGTATVLAWSFALPLGIWGAAFGGWPDRISSGITSFFSSVPELVLGLTLFLLAARTAVLPVGGMTSLRVDTLGPWARAKDILQHLIVPATALALGSLPPLLRHTRTAMREVLGCPYVQAARGHGVTEIRLILRHALPAAANPLCSLFGLSLATLLSGSLVIEVIAGWPGLGPLFLDAIFARDFYVVIAIVMLSGMFLIGGNFLADLLLYALDPRIRVE
jgi:peptide/nickel transport system permease protein